MSSMMTRTAVERGLVIGSHFARRIGITQQTDPVDGHVVPP